MEFQREKVENADVFLANIEKGENYVYSFLKETEDGIYSTELNNYARHNLYVGTAGILHMYVELYQVLKKEEYRTIIDKMTRFLENHVFDGMETAGKEGEFVPGMSQAFYSGIGGIGLVLNEVYRLNGNIHAKNGALKVLKYYKNTLTETEEGIYWSGNSPIFFDGGIILFLIDCYNTYSGAAHEEEIACSNPSETDKRNSNHTDTAASEDMQNQVECINQICAEMIRKGTDYILSHAIEHEGGAIEIDHLNVDFKHKEPNFEFGTAGAGYLFTKVYELTGDEKYLDAAKGTVNYLKSIAVRQKRGYLIPYKLGKYDNLFYLGNCHGPVGTAKLFYELYKVTGKEEYLSEVKALADGAHSLKAPFAQSAGFWNTTCICCGPAGYVPFYAGLYRATGDEMWRKLLHRVGEVLVGSRTGNHWNIAFDRTRPDDITAPAGYFTGTAGIVTALLQIYAIEKELGGITGLIDDPYTSSTTDVRHR